MVGQDLVLQYWSSLVAHWSLFGAVLCNCIGHLLFRWRMTQTVLEAPGVGVVMSSFQRMADPFMVVGFLFTVLAWALWMVSIAKFPLTYAYPFMGLNFVGLMVLGYLVLGEPITSTTLMGTLLITVGVGVIAQG